MHRLLFTLIFPPKLALGAAAFTAALVAIGGPVPGGKPIHYPDWWFQHNVIPLRSGHEAEANPVWPQHYLEADDYAVANIGQLKYIASKAEAEFELRIEGGAGLGIRALIDAWQEESLLPRDDYAAVNLGQLKYVATVFYDRLSEARYLGSPLYSSSRYPWSSLGVADDYALINIGQLKQVFSFNLVEVAEVTRPVALRSAKLWLTAEAGVITDDTYGITQWIDQSGNGFVAVPPSASARPKLNRSAHFSRDAVVFDGIDDSLSVTGFSSMMPEFSIVWLMQPASVLNNNQTIRSASSGGLTFKAFSTGAISIGTDQATQIIPGSGVGQSEDGVLSNNQWILCGFTYSEGVGTFYKNGVRSIVKGQMAAPTAWDELNLGTDNSGTLHGNLAEFLVYDTALTPQGMLAVNEYFYAKYDFENDKNFDGRYDDEDAEPAGQLSVTIVSPAHDTSLD